MNCFNKRFFINVLSIAGAISLPITVNAAGFQLWEQDVASGGNFHAGYAASAKDASTAYYNPAGMGRIKNQQVILGGNFISPNFRYRGSVAVADNIPGLGTIPVLTNPNVSVQGGAYAFVPAFHYVAPINEQWSFGLSAVTPYGLETNYGNQTALRYVATVTSIKVIDLAPALSYKLSDKFSLGLGLDIERAFAELETTVSGALVNLGDSLSKNKAQGTGYGFHLGGLYDLTNDTRVGLSYHSKVVEHLQGSSVFSGGIANAINNGQQIRSSNAKTNVPLPAFTALSIYHQYQPQLALMGTVTYTQWNVFNQLVLQNAAGPNPLNPTLPSTSIQAFIPENYRNTFNVSVGADYDITESVKLRGGLGYDETPAREAYRNVQLPDNDRYVVALGTHLQATKTIGFDFAWSHYFIHQAKINPPSQVIGEQVTTTVGNVTGGADVFGAQVVWDIL